MNGVRVYYLKLEEADLSLIDSERIESWLAPLSEQKRASILRLVDIRNRIISLVGLRLLTMCAIDEGVADFRLSEIEYPELAKPFWKGRTNNFDFNISHSGGYIIAAISTAMKVGVDVEKIKKLKRLSFKMVLSANEMEIIKHKPEQFFEFWSIKEAVVKAADTAGLARMRDVDIKGSVALMDDQQWHLNDLDLDDNYESYLASSKPVEDLIIKQIMMADLK